MGVGQKLREARLKRNLTTSEVAAATRMKIQVVEDVENESFRRIAAPIYAKGFIKLYAEFVGLNPTPLIEEYLRTIGQAAPQLETVPPSADQPQPAAAPPEPRGPPRRVPAPHVPERPDMGGFDLFNETAPDTARPPAPTLQESLRSFPLPPPAPAMDPLAAREETSGESLDERPPDDASRNVPRKLRQQPWRIASAVFAAMVMLVFILSAFSRCAPGDEPDRGAAAGSERIELAIPLPDPYID